MSFPSSVYKDLLLNKVPIEHVATRGCLHPFTLDVTDACGFKKTIVCDCGHCLRCADEAREHWASRMYLHLNNKKDNPSSPWTYAYFVTLTYGSYNLYVYKKHPFLEDWIASYPVLDNDNYTHRFAYTPSVLITRHVQNFFKRLRKAYSAKFADPVNPPILSYVYSGEYGSTYGRPHWHCIIYSNYPLCANDIQSAWSYRLVHQSQDVAVSASGTPYEKGVSVMPIGLIDFNDLYANGSLSETVNVDGKIHDAKYCFTYVAKYVRKKDDLSEKVLNRFAQIYYTLPYSKPYAGKTAIGAKNPYDTTLFRFKLCNRNLTLNNRLYEDISFEDFCKIFAPRFSSSTSFGIGKSYFVANCKRFEEGDFSLPKFRGKEIVFPRYYHYLLALQRCPLYFEKACLSGVSLAKGSYSAVRDYMCELRDNPYCVPDSVRYQTLGWTGSHIGFTDDGFVNRDWIVLKTPTNTVRCVFDYEHDEPVFAFYIYNTSTRLHERYCSMPLIDFCEFIINMIDNEIDRIEKSLKHLQMSLDLFNELKTSDAAKQSIAHFQIRRQRLTLEYRESHPDLQ